MTPRAFSDEGIVLTRRSYAEADRILSVYSKDHGRLSLIAKGVRRPISKKRGHIEVFNQIKFQVVRGRGLDLMTEAEIIDNFSEIRKSLKKVVLAYYFMEVIGRTTHEGERHPELYVNILKYLRMLKTARELKKLRKQFVYESLNILGFWPKGKILLDPDAKLAEVTERDLSSVRVGKRLLK
ncbi:MAG: repair protein RecO protein [Candidatus Woesebacteria bacterium GW2011_GWA1_40_43]|uniref:DNA repair protein RecO n=2 Tax=Candidatus Woeseibacteriota TaxID=1752722 RepID=A0A0G1QE35_9BACT|nr:MAG: repair protein RecO protein [Candidatus Woesebacteria bacterium GW2011_GWA1_40_43]KKU16023.1 MAG: repair protein RecO protein [Candidatus Woesebacteria bacterium GW2011_GWC2_45_9]